MTDFHKSHFNYSCFFYFFFSSVLTWAPVVGHVAECDLVDSSDTVAEKIGNVLEPDSVYST